MANQIKLARNTGQSQRSKFVLLVLGCFVVSMTFILVSRPQSLPFAYFNPKTSHKTSEPATSGDSSPTSQSPPIISGGDMKNMRKPLCEVSDPRFDICYMTGDVRIAGNSSVVTFAETAGQLKQESWQLHPYPRKADSYCLSRVREITVKSSSSAPECTIHHNVPAIFFSTGGYSGDFFHDFTDLLIPLYLTARQYDGEVQFVISDYSPYWIYKYLLFFQKLSKHPLINHEKEKDVHCFNHVVVGLRSHKELSIVPERAPAGYSMATFTKFMREAYSLERENMTNIEDLKARRPKLLLIQRKLSRIFTNIDELIPMADDIGFEVVVDEAKVSDMAEFAKLANSVDVLVGVHGAALTGMVFLPPKATIVQVVPWGALEELSMYKYGTPAKDMKLNYLQYNISKEESSLIEQYPLDHVVFKDPKQIHKEGYSSVQSTFLKNQDVKMDLSRFKGTLWKALEHVFI